MFWPMTSLRILTDTLTLIPFIEQLHHQFQTIVVDAGYGSEKNLTYLNELGLDYYIKYNTFEQEQKTYK